MSALGQKRTFRCCGCHKRTLEAFLTEHVVDMYFNFIAGDALDEIFGGVIQQMRGSGSSSNSSSNRSPPISVFKTTWGVDPLNPPIIAAFSPPGSARHLSNAS